MPITLHTAEGLVLPEQTELNQPSVRDEFQVQVDKDVAALKGKTARLSWPDPDPSKLFHRYVVDKAERGALKGIIRRAAVLNKVEALFYKDAITEAGHAVVKFHVARKLDKDGKPVADDTLNADGTPMVAAAPKPGAK